MTEHRLYLHTEYRENSLRCTCGQWMGKNCVDNDGFEEHVRASVERTICPSAELTRLKVGCALPSATKGQGFQCSYCGRVYIARRHRQGLTYWWEPVESLIRRNAAAALHVFGPTGRPECGWAFFLGALHEPTPRPVVTVPLPDVIPARPTDTRTTTQEDTDA
jgi:hypothetical protein